MRSIKSELLSSTAVLPAPPPERRKLFSGDLRPGQTYTVSMPGETPHTITFEDLRECLDRGDKQRERSRAIEASRANVREYLRAAMLQIYGTEPTEMDLRLADQLFVEPLRGDELRKAFRKQIW